MKNIRPFLNFTPEINKTAYIDPFSCIIGRATIAEDVSIWPMTSVRADVHEIQIGARSNIQDGSILHVTQPNEKNTKGLPLIIGKDVTIGHQCMLHGATIEDECLIGMSSVILDGAIIQKHVFVGAQSLVAPGKILESGYLYLGQPAKKIRALTLDEIAFFKKSAQNYVKLKNEYL